MMNAPRVLIVDYMTVNPNELVADMPVDERVIEELMESFQATGVMIQPVSVWLKGMQIFDGFHRTEAARRLGWDAIPCNVIDCTEEAFWDGRIISAKKHHVVERQRLNIWMHEAWKATEWDEGIIDAELQRIGIDPHGIFQLKKEERERALILTSDSFKLIPRVKQEMRTELLKIAHSNSLSTWHDISELQDIKLKELFGFTKKQIETLRHCQNQVIREAQSPLIASKLQAMDTKSLSLVLAAWDVLLGKQDPDSLIRQWFSTKARQWGEREAYIAWAVLKELDVWISDSQIEIAKQLHLSLSETILIQDKIPDAYSINTEYDGSHQKAGEKIQEYFEHRLPGQDMREYFEQKRLKRIEEQRKEKERQSQWEQTQQGQAAIEQQRATTRLRTLTIGVQSARNNIESIAHVVGLVPDAPAIMADFADFLHGFIAKYLPQLEVAEANPIALENAKLRKENNALTERVASLERALQSKESTGQLLANAVAWSSTDLDS